MIEHVCDICGEKTDDMKFRFPAWADAFGGKGNVKILAKACLTDKDVNLCGICRRRIADMIYK